MTSIYNYPQSSATTYRCTETKYKLPTSGIPTNMSVYNAQVPDYFNCYDSQYIGTPIQPNHKEGFITHNPQVAQNSYSRDFQKVKDGDNFVYVSSDPRLIDVAHAQVLALDRPAYDGSVKLDEVYSDPRLKGHGQFYRTYSDINGGDITYYTDKRIEDAFFTPVFTTSAYDVKSLYQDPMGAMKPQYDRFPIKANVPPFSRKTNYQYSLSSMDDSMEFREDLMARQMRTHNQQRWSPFWANRNEKTQPPPGW